MDFYGTKPLEKVEENGPGEQRRSLEEMRSCVLNVDGEGGG